MRINSTGATFAGSGTFGGTLRSSGVQPTGTINYPQDATRLIGHIDVEATDAYSTQKGGRVSFSGVYDAGGSKGTYGAIQGYKTDAVAGNIGGGLRFLTSSNVDGTFITALDLQGTTGNATFAGNGTFGGTVIAGSGATGGSLILAGYYSSTDYLNTFGSQYSSGGTVVGFSVRPRAGASGYTSSTSIAVSKNVLLMDGDLQFLTASSSAVPIGDVVSMTTAFSVTNAGNATFAGAVQGGSWLRAGTDTYFGIPTTNSNLWYMAADNSGMSFNQSGVVTALAFAPTTGNATFAGTVQVGGNQIYHSVYGDIKMLTGNTFGYITHQYYTTGGYDVLSIGNNFRRTDSTTGSIGWATAPTAEIRLATRYDHSSITFATTPTANTNPIDRIIINANGDITSSAYNSSIFTGTGWGINYLSATKVGGSSATTGYQAVFDHLSVRGTFSVWEMLIQQIRATNGSIFVTSVGKVSAKEGITYSSGWVVTATGNNWGYASSVWDARADSYEISNCTKLIFPMEGDYITFNADDIIMFKKVVPSSESAWTTKYFVGKFITGMPSRIAYVDVLNYSAGLTFGDLRGAEFVRIGNSGTIRNGSVYMTSDDNNAPFIDIVDGVKAYSGGTTGTNWGDFGVLKARLGNLSGISSPTMGALTGYGLYTQNAYLEGNANVIGNLSVGDGRFYAGKIKRNLLTISSEDFTGWSHSGTSTRTANTTDVLAPDGRYSATKYVTGGASEEMYKNNLEAAGTNTFTISIWMKGASGGEQTTLILSRWGDWAGIVSTGLITLTTEWKRYTATATANGVNPTYGTYLSIVTASGTVYYWGAQLELGANVSPYQKTDGTLSSDTGYGMWSIAGGFGGTMQNPVVQLDTNGVYVRNVGTVKNVVGNGSYIGHWQSTTGFCGTILDASGIYGYVSNVETFHINTSSAKISSFTFDADRLSQGNLAIGRNLSVFGQPSNGAIFGFWHTTDYPIMVMKGATEKIEIAVDTASGGRSYLGMYTGSFWQTQIGNLNVFGNSTGTGFLLRNSANTTTVFEASSTVTQIAGWAFDDAKINKTWTDGISSQGSTIRIATTVTNASSATERGNGAGFNFWNDWNNGVAYSLTIGKGMITTNDTTYHPTADGNAQTRESDRVGIQFTAYDYATAAHKTLFEVSQRNHAINVGGVAPYFKAMIAGWKFTHNRLKYGDSTAGSGANMFGVSLNSETLNSTDGHSSELTYSKGLNIYWHKTGVHSGRIEVGELTNNNGSQMNSGNQYGLQMYYGAGQANLAFRLSMDINGAATAIDNQIAGWRFDSATLWAGQTAKASITYGGANDGLRLDSDGSITSKKFKVTTAGVLYATDGIFSGTITGSAISGGTLAVGALNADNAQAATVAIVGDTTTLKIYSSGDDGLSFISPLLWQMGTRASGSTFAMTLHATYRMFEVGALEGSGTKMGLRFGAYNNTTVGDTNLYRDSANVLKTDDALMVGVSIKAPNVTYNIYSSHNEAAAAATSVVPAFTEWIETGLSTNKIRCSYVHRIGNTKIRLTVYAKSATGGENAVVGLTVNGSYGGVSTSASTYTKLTTTYDVTALTSGNIYEIIVSLGTENEAEAVYMKQVVVDVESTA
jgi:hypothetical protein